MHPWVASANAVQGQSDERGHRWGHDGIPPTESPHECWLNGQLGSDHHQANPHVHISVRAESNRGKRLNPRKADLHRWRETFAEKLHGHGIEAEATRQATRGRSWNDAPLWRLKTLEDGRLRAVRSGVKNGMRASATRAEAVQAWEQLGQALAMSAEVTDRKLAQSIAVFLKDMPSTQAAEPRRRAPEMAPHLAPTDIGPQR